MTRAQWLWEFQAIQKKEEDDANVVIESLKAIEKMLVHLLGLNLLQDDDDENESIIPLSLFTGRREIIEAIMEKIGKDVVAKEAISDDQFNDLSAAFARGEVEDLGDMDPIIEEQIAEVAEQDRQKHLASIGVKVVDEIPDAPHFKLDIDRMQERIREVTTSRTESEKHIEEVVKKPVTMTFDDDVNDA